MLFEVSRDGHTIHLFGGSRPTTTPWSSPAVEALAVASQVFWNEAPAIGPEIQTLAVKYGVDPARPLDSWLSDDLATRVAATVERLGADAALVAHLRPWLAAQVLRMAADAHDGLVAENAAEAVLTRRVVGAGISVNSEFGTPEETLATFAAMSPEAEIQYLRFTLHEVESGLPRTAQQAAALARGDLRPIEDETAMMRDSWPALYDYLLVRRNYAWLPRIDAMFAERSRAFICVGTAHLVGGDGLLKLLPRADYIVAPHWP